MFSDPRKAAERLNSEQLAQVRRAVLVHGLRLRAGERVLQHDDGDPDGRVAISDLIALAEVGLKAIAAAGPAEDAVP